MPGIRKVKITAFGDESKLRTVSADLPAPRPRHNIQAAHRACAQSDKSGTIILRLPA